MADNYWTSMAERESTNSLTVYSDTVRRPFQYKGMRFSFDAEGNLIVDKNEETEEINPAEREETEEISLAETEEINLAEPLEDANEIAVQIIADENLADLEKSLAQTICEDTAAVDNEFETVCLEDDEQNLPDIGTNLAVITETRIAAEETAEEQTVYETEETEEERNEPEKENPEKEEKTEEQNAPETEEIKKEQNDSQSEALVDGQNNSKKHIAKYIFIDTLLGIPALAISYTLLTALIAVMFVLSIVFTVAFAVITGGFLCLIGYMFVKLLTQPIAAITLLGIDLILGGFGVLLLFEGVIIGFIFIPKLTGLYKKISTSLHLYK